MSKENLDASLEEIKQRYSAKLAKILKKMVKSKEENRINLYDL